ncbi:MAG: chromosomal replication initiator protein DnaA [Clostridia bacterium]|nr:chromosomal replication initiator protein DnaA [Clostridia bacterium]
MDFNDKTWSEIKQQISESDIIKSFQYETWIRPIERVCFKDKILYIWAPSPVAVKAIQNNYTEIIRDYASRVTNKLYEIHVLDPNENLPASDAPALHQNPANNLYKESNLNPKYTFDKFVVGSSNKMAHAYSLLVAEMPGSQGYNPLFIYGGPGLGKTHLSQAIGHFMKTNNPSANIIYVPAETYTNEYIRSLQNRTTEQFREKYRKADLLIVDDIQFISGKEATITEFFHTFNELYQNNKQIVLTSDRAPKKIQNIDERLVSRFMSGMTCDITKPDYETRYAILKNNSAAADVVLTNEVIHYIAEHVKSNVRELEGALNKIVAYEKLKIEPVTMEVAERILQDYIFSELDKNITHDVVKEEVAEYFGITVDDIMSDKKVKNIAEARQVAMFISFNKVKNTNVTLVAKEYGKHHSTISHAVEKINHLMGKDEEISSAVRDIISKLTES